MRPYSIICHKLLSFKFSFMPMNLFKYYPIVLIYLVSLFPTSPSDLIPEGDYFLRRAGPIKEFFVENGKDGRLVLGGYASQKGLFRLFYPKNDFVCNLQSMNSRRVVQFRDPLSCNKWDTHVVLESLVGGIGAFSEEVTGTTVDFEFHSIDARTRAVVLRPLNYVENSINWFLDDSPELNLTTNESDAIKLIFVKANL